MHRILKGIEALTVYYSTVTPHFHRLSSWQGNCFSTQPGEFCFFTTSFNIFLHAWPIAKSIYLSNFITLTLYNLSVVFSHFTTNVDIKAAWFRLQIQSTCFEATCINTIHQPLVQVIVILTISSPSPTTYTFTSHAL